MPKKKFYIIGHNPNTVAEATMFLDAGANALEPDVVYNGGDPGGDRYYIHHPAIIGNENPPTVADGYLSLVNYLQGLAQYMTTPGNESKLSLIAFDIKNPGEPGFDINDFLSVVWDAFSSANPDVALLITVSGIDAAGFLTKLDRAGLALRHQEIGKLNLAVGIDECGDPGKVESMFMNAGQTIFAYANGIAVTPIPPITQSKSDIYSAVYVARGKQAIGAGRSFRFVYSWAFNDRSSIQAFLDLYVDGLIVDIPGIRTIQNLLADAPFKSTYQLARTGDNPFANLLSTYMLTVKTRRQFLTNGEFHQKTDARIQFTLKGSKGTLRTVVDARYDGVLERSSTDFVVLEGANIGTVVSLMLSVLNDNNTPWHPEKITIESSLLPAPVVFMYGEEDSVSIGVPVKKTVG